jgi:histidinol-phosphate aminotransferase
LVEKLKKAGVKHHCDGGNYLLIWPSSDTSACELALRNEGILVRSMTGKALIDGALRVSIGTKSQMKEFWKVFKQSGVNNK